MNNSMFKLDNFSKKEVLSEKEKLGLEKEATCSACYKVDVAYRENTDEAWKMSEHVDPVTNKKCEASNEEILQV